MSPRADRGTADVLDYQHVPACDAAASPRAHEGAGGDRPRRRAQAPARLRRPREPAVHRSHLPGSAQVRSTTPLREARLLTMARLAADGAPSCLSVSLRSGIVWGAVVISLTFFARASGRYPTQHDAGRHVQRHVHPQGHDGVRERMVRHPLPVILSSWYVWYSRAPAVSRSMAMDTRVYHDPETFKPERFLPGPHGGPEMFPHASFGFGRR